MGSREGVVDLKIEIYEIESFFLFFSPGRGWYDMYDGTHAYEECCIDGAVKSSRSAGGFAVRLHRKVCTFSMDYFIGFW